MEGIFVGEDLCPPSTLSLGVMVGPKEILIEANASGPHLSPLSGALVSERFLRTLVATSRDQDSDMALSVVTPILNEFKKLLAFQGLPEQGQFFLTLDYHLNRRHMLYQSIV